MKEHLNKSIDLLINIALSKRQVPLDEKKAIKHNVKSTGDKIISQETKIVAKTIDVAFYWFVFILGANDIKTYDREDVRLSCKMFCPLR